MAEAENQRTCGLCKSNQAKYQCPRCNIMYCSVNCYKSQAHIKCSEGFYKECVMDEMKSLGLSDEEKKRSVSKMQEILKRESKLRTMDDEDLEILKRQELDEGEVYGDELNLPSTSYRPISPGLKGEALHPLNEEDRETLIGNTDEEDSDDLENESEGNEGENEKLNKIKLCEHEKDKQEEQQQQERIKLETEEEILIRKALEMTREELEEVEADNPALDYEDVDEPPDLRFEGVDIEHAEAKELYARMNPRERLQFHRFIQNVHKMGGEVIDLNLD